MFEGITILGQYVRNDVVLVEIIIKGSNILSIGYIDRQTNMFKFNQKLFILIAYTYSVPYN